MNEKYDKIQHNLSGFSGNFLKVIRKENKTIVKKIATDFQQNIKLDDEIKKLQTLKEISKMTTLFHVPSLLLHGINENGLKFYEMEFIPGESLDSCLHKLSPGKIMDLSKQITNIIKIISTGFYQQVESNLTEHEYLMEKFRESLDNISNQNFNSKFSNELKNEYKLKILNLIFKQTHLTNNYSFCHGDLALDNILLTRTNEIYLIDPLKNKFECIMWDISKVLQSSIAYWNLIKINNFIINTSQKKIELYPHEHLTMFHEHFLEDINNYNHGSIMIYLAATIARVIKYAKTEKQYCALLMITNELLSNYMEGRYDLNGSLSTLCR